MVVAKQPLITVVMPNYNGRSFVEQAIDSVLCQTYPNFELLVVDDCSTDDSLQLIQQKAQCDNRIRIIALAHNVGVANARNAGIAEAKGEYIALLDNDDLWTEDKLERQLALAQKGADIVYCSFDQKAVYCTAADKLSQDACVQRYQLLNELYQDGIDAGPSLQGGILSRRLCFVDGTASNLSDRMWRPEGADALPAGDGFQIQSKRKCGEGTVEHIPKSTEAQSGCKCVGICEIRGKRRC